MRKSFLFFVFTLFLGLESYACKCAFSTEDLREQIKAYEFVFYAKVESLEDNKIEGFERTVHYMRDSTYYKKGGYQPRLEVLEIFKGNVEKDLEGDFLVMDNGWSNCGEYFQTGQLVLIFGHKGRNGGIATTICSPNLTFKSHEDFLRKKKEIQEAA